MMLPLRRYIFSIIVIKQNSIMLCLQFSHSLLFLYIMPFAKSWWIFSTKLDLKFNWIIFFGKQIYLDVTQAKQNSTEHFCLPRLLPPCFLFILFNIVLLVDQNDWKIKRGLTQLCIFINFENICCCGWELSVWTLYYVRPNKFISLYYHFYSVFVYQFNLTDPP
jgi:hypothetical protein